MHRNLVKYVRAWSDINVSRKQIDHWEACVTSVYKECSPIPHKFWAEIRCVIPYLSSYIISRVTSTKPFLTHTWDLLLK